MLAIGLVPKLVRQVVRIVDVGLVGGEFGVGQIMEAVAAQREVLLIRLNMIDQLARESLQIPSTHL